MKSGKLNLLLGFPFVKIECDFLFRASLEELSDVVGVLLWVAVIDYYVVDYTPITCESRERFVHSPIVVFRDGGYTIGGAQKLKA